MGQTASLVELHRSWPSVKWEFYMFRYEIKYSRVCVILKLPGCTRTCIKLYVTRCDISQ